MAAGDRKIKVKTFGIINDPAPPFDALVEYHYFVEDKVGGSSPTRIEHVRFELAATNNAFNTSTGVTQKQAVAAAVTADAAAKGIVFDSLS